MTTPPVTPPAAVTPPTLPAPKAPIYTGIQVFGWLTALGGGAFFFFVVYKGQYHSLGALGAGFALVLMGGWCINRDPLVSFAQAIARWISAWRGKGDDRG